LKWLEDKCRESNTFAWGAVVVAIAVMVVIVML
jgi:hypothetical protein